jgi:hypoxanthine phosphoribosyltransferase
VEQEFATPTEEGLARLFDALGIEWEYEPREFELEWYADGRVRCAFRPDFYLPGLDRYVEVTTQSKLNKKNRKMRLMGELHPDVEVYLVGRRELAALA